MARIAVIPPGSYGTDTYDVTDVFGMQVSTRTLPEQDGYHNTTIGFKHALTAGLTC